MTIVVSLDARREHGDELRALRSRPDEAHVAPNDVDQLRKLVERGAADERAEGGPTIVSLHSPGPEVAGRAFVDVRIGSVTTHRSELEHLERAPVIADTRLAEEDRPAHRDEHANGEK